MSFWGKVKSFFTGDGMFHAAHGPGRRSDKSAGGKFCDEELDPEELCALYKGSGLIKRAVAGPYVEALRNGWSIKSKDTDPDKLAKIKEQLEIWDAEQKISSQVLKHFSQVQLFGGGVMLQIESKAKQSKAYMPTKGLDAVFRSFAPQELKAEGSKVDPRYGFRSMPQSFGFSNDESVFTLHSSWARVEGTDSITGLQDDKGWVGPSVLQSFYQQYRSLGISTQAVVTALQNMGRWAYRVEGAEQFAMAGNQNAMLQRLAYIEEAASTFQPIMLSTREDMQAIPQSISGVKDVESWVVMTLCAEAQIPVTVLFGTSPGGFGTGEAELRAWHDRGRNVQRMDVAPVLRWMLQRVFDAGIIDKPDGDWSIEFAPIRTPTPSEDAEIRLKMAQADAMNINSGMISADEAAISRFGNGFSVETVIDPTSRGEEDPFEQPLEGEEDPEPPNQPPAPDEPQDEPETPEEPNEELEE